MLNICGKRMDQTGCTVKCCKLGYIHGNSRILPARNSSQKPSVLYICIVHVRYSLVTDCLAVRAMDYSTERRHERAEHVIG